MELLSDDGERDVPFERFAVTLLVHESTPLSHREMCPERPDTQLGPRQAELLGLERRERVDTGRRACGHPARERRGRKERDRRRRHRDRVRRMHAVELRA